MPQTSDEFAPRWYSRFKRVFQIFLVSYLIMLLLPAAGMLYLYREITLMAEQNCAEKALTAVEDKAAELRAELNWMDNTAGRFLLDSNVTAMLFADPLSYGDSRLSTFTAFSEHLNDRIGTYDADSLGYRFLFQNSELVFYEESMSKGLEFVFDTILNYENMTYKQWYDAVFTPNHRNFMPACTINRGKVPLYAITYNYPIVRRKDNETYKAVLQFFLPVSKLIPDQFHELSTGYLLTNSGELLATFGADSTVSPTFTALTQSSGWVRQAGGLLVYTRFAPDLMLVQMIPDKVAFQDVQSLRTTLLLLFLLCAVVEGVLSWYLARRNALPIETLASNMTQMLSTPRQGNEFDYLRQGIVQLRHVKETADEAVARSRQAELAMLIHRLLNYHSEDAEQLLQTGERLGIALQTGGYCVAAAALPQSAEFDPNQPLPQPPDKMQVFICEGQRSTLNILYLCESVPSPGTLESVLAHLQQLHAVLPQGTRIGLGRPCTALEDVTFSFGQATFCLQNDEQNRPIVQFDQITPSLNSLCFPLEQQQRLLNAVKHNNTAVIDQEFDVLLEENTVRRHLSSLLKRTLLSSVEALLLMAAENAAQGNNLSDYLRSIPHDGDFRTELSILRQEFKKVAHISGERFSHQASSQRQEMEDYLEAHFSDSMLSIGGMADHFGFSESYFSVLFKELLGEPYSLYLEKLRLKKAAELLRTTDLSIEDVSLQAGYNNSTTFRRAFKRVKGLSPVQYRNQ